MAFKTFETEEEYTAALNEALEEKNKGWIADRLETARTNAVKELKAQYADYEDLKKSNEDMQAQIAAFGTKQADFDKEVAEWSEKKKKIESKAAEAAAEALKLRAAAKYGIPFDMADRLRGTSAEEIEKDAKDSAKFFTQRQAPLKNPEAEQVDGVTAAFRKLNPNLKI